ncbi:glycoside hydrolase family 15 protein [Deinococcus peraridilitoris]|uniref:Glycosyl hydrolase, glucoamylase n=1 Tax=Deinococcus peraridilitoris (strain DSM 19664 / LMG 22246 / CIP 109416 / KR-200) TaxID=937777 RepID=L0A8D6_DEIPD|nr:glycoside hydrolase family 15 protein [Deinococcus peraridilitoris]AFZ69684.1 glycosyl hydrolase, glucoamylase [Deinococcus peraridilitoris DSM 19664]
MPDESSMAGSGESARSIRDLGLLSDRRTSALVTRTGDIIWYSPQRFDAPTLFAALLDEQGGGWTLDTPGLRPSGRAYLGDSAVLETRLRHEQGELVVTDFLMFAPDLPRGLCRVFSATPDELRFTVRPAPNYAREPGLLRAEGNAVVINDGLYLYASHPLHVQGAEIHGLIPAGEPGWAFLTGSQQERLDWEIMTRWRAATLLHWRDVTTHATYRGPYEQEVAGSLRALRMLTYQESGAVLAAATTSLPEIVGGELNWDYRYVWLRDTGMIVSALTRAGGDGREGRAFLDFVCQYGPRDDGHLPIAPFLTADGQQAPEEEELDLAGYALSAPVRIGNGARGQLQLDAYANVLLAAKLIYDHFGTREHWELVECLAEFLCEHWREDDYGIWEERTKRPYVTGKVVTATALKYLQQYAVSDEQRGRWQNTEEDIRAWVKQYGLTKTGAYAYIAGGEAVDVTAALYPVWGYCEADSPEMLATIDVLERDYRVGNLYWRHLEAESVRREGTFLAGTLWVAQYWVMRDVQRAKVILEAALEYANDLHLFAEEADPHTGRMLGNFPQSFVHAAFIGVIVDYKAALEKAEEA